MAGEKRIQKTPTPRAKARWLAACALGGLMLQACSKKPPDRLGIPIEGYNHTSAAINYFMVNGSGGPNIRPYGGGGSQTCCVSMPRQWRPGLTVVVEWEKDPTPHAYADWPERMFSDAWHARMKKEKLNNTRHRAIVEVAPYEKLGAITAHFLPCDQVKISAGPTYLGMPNHPYNYPMKMEVPAVCPKS